MESRASQRLAQLSSNHSEIPKRTIYRVHKNMRNVNPMAYDPEVVSIGPYHHGKENLKMMEECKLTYMHLLLKSKPNQNFDMYVSAIKPLKNRARECYAEDITSMKIDQFVEMLVIDGCFIIQLMKNFSNMLLISEDDPIIHMSWMRNSLRRDLILIENQIPFFIILELFTLIEGGPNPQWLLDLLFNFFQHIYPGKGYTNNRDRNPDEIKHLLDLVHGNWRPASLDPSRHVFTISKVDCARNLKDANVKFVTVDQNSVFDVEFQNGTLMLAPIDIYDSTETLFRNLIAYEQYFENNMSSFVTDYAILMDFLIDSWRDVEILCGAKIINNGLGEDQMVVNLFNKLNHWITASTKRGFRYGKVIEHVHTHCQKPINRHVAALRHNYLNGPWQVLSIVVAVIVIVLASTQTVCSILQVIPKHQ